LLFIAFFFAFCFFFLFFTSVCFFFLYTSDSYQFFHSYDTAGTVAGQFSFIYFNNHAVLWHLLLHQNNLKTTFYYTFFKIKCETLECEFPSGLITQGFKCWSPLARLTFTQRYWCRAIHWSGLTDSRLPLALEYRSGWLDWRLSVFVCGLVGWKGCSTDFIECWSRGTEYSCKRTAQVRCYGLNSLLSTMEV
jgi:hypothetical protein